MFSGIVRALGYLESREGSRLTLRWPELDEKVGIGDSIAVNGVCLTAVEVNGERFSVDAVEETFKRTSLGDLGVGDRVNLERPLRMGGTLDGHLVQGHVDTVGTVMSAAPNLSVSVERSLLRYVVEKGSITIDGVSLTVVEVQNETFSVAVIPHTAEVTTLGLRAVGDLVNLEFDVLAKYVERLLSYRDQ